MANRRPQQGGGRRMDFRNDRNKGFGRNSVSPWQGGGPGGGLPSILPLGANSTEATLALASNIINLLQPRQNPVPSLLDMPIRRDFVPNMGRFDRGYMPNRMGNQNFRRTGNYNRSGERINNNRKPFRPNDGQKQQNKSTPKKEADSKAKPAKESEKQDGQDKEKTEKDIKVEKDGEEKKKEAPKTRYDDIVSQLLRCHICNKSMWDGRSFENHLGGRAHAIMMQKTAESYALTADTMRQEFKIREMKRTRKTGVQQSRDFYCAMCDLYAADGPAHRTTVGHRKLKKYLHPACTCCHKEMPTRIELDEHRLSAEHMRTMQDKQEFLNKPKEVMSLSTLAMEQSYLRDDRWRRRRRDSDKQDKQEKDEAKEDGVEVKKETEDATEEEPKQDGEEKPTDKEDTILDYVEGDDLTAVTKEQFPTYNVSRGVGRSFLEPFSCVQCKLCRKLLESEEAADVHVRTWRHHQLFLRLLHEKTQPQENKTQEDAQENAEAEQPAEDGNTNNKRSLNSDESGNWKRRKTTPDDEDAEQNGHDDDADGKDEPSGEGEQNQAGGWGDDCDMPSADELEDWGETADKPDGIISHIYRLHPLKIPKHRHTSYQTEQPSGEGEQNQAGGWGDDCDMPSADELEDWGETADKPDGGL
ncbi:hypothetical protein NE865_02227 [Phthorimaea operculella]|nr:hypothetical protein NE865_02227 [Phthorimaea operculella]